MKGIKDEGFLGPGAPDPIHVSLVLPLEFWTSSTRRRLYGRIAARHNFEIVHQG
jgi:hypothetical protein